MKLTVIHTGEQVSVLGGLVREALTKLAEYKKTARNPATVHDALWELRHGRTISTDTAGVSVRVDESLLTDTHYKARERMLV